MSDFPLVPGDMVRRVTLHDTFGGNRQSGISPSARSNNILIFTDASSGEQHGYLDSWKSDGCFHYTGEGQRGDQSMDRANLAILNARSVGRALRLFKGAGGEVTYLGRFALDEALPWYMTDAPETGQGPIRSVIVFRLRPLNALSAEAAGASRVPDTLIEKEVAIEGRHTESVVIEPSGVVYEAVRREARLVERFVAYLKEQGREATRKHIHPPGEAAALFNDIYISSLRLLVEAKSSADRCSIRMALGQLLDYGRFYSGDIRRAVLLPHPPSEDLINLLRSAGVLLIVPCESKFVLIDGHGRRELFPRV